MLKSLYISNYAIIDELSIEFSHGLNIITGETGAGKSILLGALELVTGSRADTSVLHDQKNKCIVEANFDIHSYNLESLFNEKDLDYEAELIIRREINPAGRSRAFINDSPVNLKVLTAITEKLINIHRQFGAQDIFERGFQTMVLDAMADQLELARNYRKDYKELRHKTTLLEQLEASIRAGIKEEEFIRFQLNEILEIDPNPLQDNNLTEEIKRIEHAEEISNCLKITSYKLTEDEQSIVQNLRQLYTQLAGIETFGESYSKLSQRLQSIIAELEDLASEADDLIDGNPHEVSEIETLKLRYDSIQKLLFKHQLDSLDDLIAFKADMELKLEGHQVQTGNKQVLEQEIATIDKKLRKQANLLSKGRKAIKKQFETQVKEILTDLSMKNSYFDVNLEVSEDLTPYGLEWASYYFSANPGIPAQLLKDVASGGEMSRLTLCIQSLVAGKFSLPSMIFDEIDSGVSGDTAQRMGSMLSSLGKKHQMVVITHTPQVAASGAYHYFVEKKIEDKRTRTNIRKLEAEERLLKIAIMLSSDPPASAAIETAKELMKNK
jgi:DNA repair protein RecN (Recombination protein N)